MSIEYCCIQLFMVIHLSIWRIWLRQFHHYHLVLIFVLHLMECLMFLGLVLDKDHKLSQLLVLVPGIHCLLLLNCYLVVLLSRGTN